MVKALNRLWRRSSLIVVALVGLIIAAESDKLLNRQLNAQTIVPQQHIPGWSFTGNLNSVREGHTATLLGNDKVLVVGGWKCEFGEILATTELYDPSTKVWTYSGSLAAPRALHTATLLNSGKVLVSGGMKGWTTEDEPTDYSGTAEIYDPATGTWSPAPPPSSKRLRHASTLLKNGKVLVVGGSGLDIAEVDDPVNASWSPASEQRVHEARTFVLGDGRVLLLGRPPNASEWKTQIYDPVSNSWSNTGDFTAIGSLSSATLLTNGKVLATGYGRRPDLDPYSFFAEIYDPVTGTWSRTSAPDPSVDIVDILLPNGKVLLVSYNFAEIYDPLVGKWNITARLIPHPVATGTLLPDGDVLFTFNVGCNANSSMLFDHGAIPSGSVTSVSAATYSRLGLTSEGIASAFDTALATTTVAAVAQPLPIHLGGTTVKVRDVAGVERLAPLFFVSPTQVNYQIPEGTASGVAEVVITNSDGVTSNGVALVNTVAPGIFAADSSGKGVAAGLVFRLKADGSQSFDPVAEFDAVQKRFVPRPIDLGPESDRVFLVLFGTGIRHRNSVEPVTAYVGAYNSSEVVYAGAQGDFAGLDQINIQLPRSLAGRGVVNVIVYVDGYGSNMLQVSIK